MTEEATREFQETLDDDGFLRELSDWSRSMAEELAEKNEIGPLSEKHWQIIEFVKQYFENHGTGPPVVRIGKDTGMTASEICRLFPCGVVKGAYRLAGLPRPPGCI